MQKKQTVREWQERWAQAVDRAAEEQRADVEPERALLNDAAGLHVESGVRGGAWTHTVSCNGSCATECIC